MNKEIKIVLADDHSLMRAAITGLLERNGYTVLAQAASYIELEKVFLEKDIELLICDCRMEGQGPLNFLKFIKRFHSQCKVIFLTGLESEVLFQQLLTAGVNAIVSKKGEVDDILIAINHVMQDKTYLSKTFQKKIENSANLTVTEYQVMELLIQGLTNNQLADQLNKAPGTINNHRVNIMRKLNLHNIVELVHYCRENGLYDN